MDLPTARMAAHAPDSAIPWAHTHPGIQHTHVIPDRDPVEMKNALGDHIDRHHFPITRRGEGPSGGEQQAG